MAVAADSAVDIWSGNEHAGICSRTVGGRVTGNDRVFQRHAWWSNTNATTGSFRSVSRWLVGATLVDSGVACLCVVQTQCSMLEIYGGCIVVCDRATMRKPACAVHATVEPAVCLSAVAAIATGGRVVSKRGGVDD